MGDNLRKLFLKIKENGFVIKGANFYSKFSSNN